MRADGRASRTVRAYVDAAEQFASFAAVAGFPADLAAIRRAHVEAFMADQVERHAAATAATRFRCLQQFFRFAVGEGELRVSPMASMVGPTVEAKAVSVFTDDELERLVAACEGQAFDDRRDAAIVRLFMDTGMRLSEMVGLTVSAVDLDGQVVEVSGTGGRTRAVAFGDRAVVALDRYLRARRRHAHAEEVPLWLGVRGRLTDSGLSQMLDRRAASAGVEAMSARRFRDTFAYRWLAAGCSVAELQRIGGWQSPQLLARYRRAGVGGPQ